MKWWMRKILIVAVGVAALCATGCGAKGKVLGTKPKEPLYSILAVHAGDAPATLSLEGTMVEKCPQAGCWFKIEDGTGLMKVDTKAAGFVVTGVPLKAKVKVSGKVTRTGDELVMQATGLSY